jgi:hypothetical protein
MFHQPLTSARAALGWCARHEKLTFATRKQARASRRANPGIGSMRPHRCDATLGWHLGHLPRAVRQGVRTASEHYGTAG